MLRDLEFPSKVFVETFVEIFFSELSVLSFWVWFAYRNFFVFFFFSKL